MKKIKLVFIALFTIIASIVFYKLYHVHFNYRFTEVSKNKVYRSGTIPTDKIDDYIEKYGIKTVIDLRNGHIVHPLNPAFHALIEDEKSAVELVEGVNYVNIPSDQIPSEENIDDFYKTLDNKDAYPVLIHCHHGTGRAVLYSALYQIEYDGLNNQEARKKTKFPLFLSSFDDGTPKGEWLKNYKKRSSTVNGFATKSN